MRRRVFTCTNVRHSRHKKPPATAASFTIPAIISPRSRRLPLEPGCVSDASLSAKLRPTSLPRNSEQRPPRNAMTICCRQHNVSDTYASSTRTRHFSREIHRTNNRVVYSIVVMSSACTESWLHCPTLSCVSRLCSFTPLLVTSYLDISRFDYACYTVMELFGMRV